MTQQQLTSFLGIATFIALAWLMSSNKRKFPWRIVMGGLGLQLVLAFLILRTDYGRWIFDRVNIVFTSLLKSSEAGSKFMFGQEAMDQHIFAFKILPTIIFFSALMSIFYYYGIIQKIVGVFAMVMQKTLGTSGAETLSSAANVFVGQTEAPLVIRPYISSMTQSELNTVMVGGFATMAGGVLGALVFFGIDAGHLLSASLISAPGAILLSKIMLPETGQPKTLGNVKIDVDDDNVNVLDAIASGTVGGLKLALNVGAMLIVFIALVAVLNTIVGWVGMKFGFVAGEDGTLPLWSIETALSYIFYPFAWLIGIEKNDCMSAGQLMGIKMATNEFYAYIDLASMAKSSQISERSMKILTYALCGFANFSSIGIQLGGIGGIAPNRSGDLAKLGLRAMLGGTLAAFITACFANILLPY